MSEQNSAASASVNRAKPYQLMLFPLNNGATNVYYVWCFPTLPLSAARFWP